MNPDVSIRGVLSALITVGIAVGSLGAGGTAALAPSSAHAAEGDLFRYTFSWTGRLDEASSASRSSSPYFWLSSGGYLYGESGVGKTITGSLKTNDPMRTEYAAGSALVSDNGYRPQNLFRLLTKESWDNTATEFDLTITDNRVRNEQNAHPWNGAFVVSRYHDSDEYYVGGIRADGTAVIKKKKDGAWTTLESSAKLFSGTFDAHLAPSLLPTNTPLALRLTTTNTGGGVALTLELKTGGTWKTVATATDSTRPLTTAGRSGMLLDQMDATFDNFAVRESGSASKTISPTSSTEPTTSSVSTETTATTETTYTGGGSYGLSSNRTVVEAGSQTGTKDSEWWVSSGAYFKIANGVGSTIQGKLSSTDPWRTAYAKANPTDTDNGYRPQNIFRLVTTGKRNNQDQTVYFRVNEYNESASPNRAGHNGVLFFNRYLDSQTLYYTGVRVDGTAVIKKKSKGTYTTLTQQKIFSGTYNRSSSPNLIPEDRWIGMRSTVRTLSNGNVEIKLYVDTAGNGTWKLAAETIDSGTGGARITGTLRGGVRTDFMDADFKNYSFKEL